MAATPQVADAGAAKNVGNAAGVPAAPDHGADPDALLAAIALGAIGSSAAKAVGDGSTGGAVAKTAMVNPAGERPAADGEPNKATVQNSQSAKAAGAHHNPGKGTGNPGAGNGNANSGGNGKQTAANFGGEQTTQAGPSTNANTNARQIAMDPAFKATLLNTTSHGATQAAVAGSMTEQIAGAPADPTATSSTNNGTTVAQMTKVAAPKLPVLPQLTGAANQVAMQLTQAVSDGATKFTMRLHPAQLGRVDVSLEISADGRVTAVVSADRQETLDLLRNDSQCWRRPWSRRACMRAPTIFISDCATRATIMPNAMARTGAARTLIPWPPRRILSPVSGRVVRPSTPAAYSIYTFRFKGFTSWEIGAATTQIISAADSSGKKLAKEFDNFLILLTTQLQNQDPLEPLDSNEFTAQLVRFTNVEQAIAQNKKLEQLVELLQASGGAAGVNYLGKNIEAIGSEADLNDGQALWSYELSKPSEATTVLVKDSGGNVVFSTTGNTSTLKQGFVWDGKTTGGFDSPDGVYDIEVVATDIKGAAIPVQTTVGGVVTGVEILDGQQMLAIGGAKVSINNVLAVTQG